MAEKEMNAIVKNVTKTTDEWASATEIPAKGAICVETTADGDTKIKIGDGINTFSGLKYIDCKNADTADFVLVNKILGSTDTILSWAALKVGTAYAFIVAENGYPTDAPLETEATVRVEGDGYIRQTVFWSQYGNANAIYKRTIFQGAWLDDWQDCRDGGNAAILEGFHANEIASNPNLLINPDFKVNQQGKTKYDTAGFTVDKWRIQNGVTATITSSGVRLDALGKIFTAFYQTYDGSLKGKNITFSIKASGSGTLRLGIWTTKTINIELTDVPTVYAVSTVCEDEVDFGMWLSEKEEYAIIEWAKLELGSLATPFIPPNPALELLKVQAINDKDLCRLIDVIGGIKNGCATETTGTIMTYGDRSVTKTNDKLAYFGWTLDSEEWFVPIIVSQYANGISYNMSESAVSYEEGAKNYPDKVASFEYKGRNYFACWQNSSSYQNPQVSGGYKIEFSGDYISMCKQLIDYCESLTLDGKHASDFAIYKGCPNDNDCNNALLQGVYSVSANSANAPNSKYFTIAVDVAGNGDWITQTAITAETDPRIHRRVRINNVWGEWKNIADGGDAATVSGHTVESDIPAGAKFINAGTGASAEVFNGLAPSAASGGVSHAEGATTTASGYCSHAEGMSTKASGDYSHAEGRQSTASGFNSHAEGFFTKANAHQHVTGHYNKEGTDGTPTTTEGDAFIIGNGSSDTARSNAFRVAYNGTLYATNATISTGADYAEYFEWADGNPNSEDRVGHFVTFDETNTKKIRLATSADDYILGIVSGMPSVIGNGDEDWKQRFVLDDFGRYITENFTYTDEDGNEQIGVRWKQNPDYDSTQKYIPRAERKEWSAIGMLGVLSVIDNGQCVAGKYCSVANDGTAIPSETGYRVIKRVSEDVVEVVFR